MTSHRKHIYVHFPKLDVFYEEMDISMAERRIKGEFPRAAFSDWQQIGEADILVAWADMGRKFRHLLGEESTLAKPDAFVLCQDVPIREAECRH